jgi:hypothetical protein
MFGTVIQYVIIVHVLNTRVAHPLVFHGFAVR